MAYIYCIKNKINQKRYIGKTNIGIVYRFKEHLKQRDRQDRKHFPLYLAFKKYGIENFTIELIEECDDNKANDKEKYWIKYFNTYGKDGYNATLGGDGQLKYNYNEVAKTYSLYQSVNKTAEVLGCSEMVVIHACNKHNINTKDKAPVPCKVQRLDKNTEEVLQEYHSYLEAARDMANKNYIKDVRSAQTHISLVARGKRKTCAGFKWKKKDN